MIHKTKLFVIKDHDGNYIIPYDVSFKEFEKFALEAFSMTNGIRAQAHLTKKDVEKLFKERAI